MITHLPILTTFLGYKFDSELSWKPLITLSNLNTLEQKNYLKKIAVFVNSVFHVFINRGLVV